LIRLTGLGWASDADLALLGLPSVHVCTVCRLHGAWAGLHMYQPWGQAVSDFGFFLDVLKQSAT
jgi:hypothetical protein